MSSHCVMQHNINYASPVSLLPAAQVPTALLNGLGKLTCARTQCNSVIMRVDIKLYTPAAAAWQPAAAA